MLFIFVYAYAGTFIHGCKSLFLRQQKKKEKKFIFVWYCIKFIYICIEICLINNKKQSKHEKRKFNL